MPWAALGGAAVAACGAGGGEDGPGKVGQRAIVLEMLTTICQLFGNYLTTFLTKNRCKSCFANHFTVEFDKNEKPEI